MHRKASPRFYAWKRKQFAIAKSRSVNKEQSIERGVPQSPPYVRTMSGRMRRLPLLNVYNEGVRGAAERQAISTIVQGSAADIMKRAMIDVHAALLGSSVQPVLTVHDELVTICPHGKEDWAVKVIKKNMEGAADLRVPLKVDINVCNRWSEGK